MNGVSITIDLTGIDQALAALSRLVSGVGDEDMMSAIGAIGESQTRRRITDEKTGPDGQAWPPNREGGSILHKSGQHLLGSIAWTASPTEAKWGASWEYAHVHQFGAEIVPKNKKALYFMVGGQAYFAKKVTIPPRPFIGLSEDNARQLLQIVTDHFGKLLS
ncbi:phage virion morphogenesis protein [Prosthecodimorpha staleyi]|uniref:Phage virion morphogenesis protein n=1 Tax=Prosthecodimorpha staleyi TaxID=2840188 RepID=A0A947D9K7_9HYPH|nr:phage virion morphogenesis protein [Prosthecodimorpha staleyi]MBT9293335.1 phage virion morphogenesis protein [Prosthecodimorpha staleyi]